MEVSKDQLEQALQGLSKYFGGLIDFQYDESQGGIKAEIPADLTEPPMFERTCANVVSQHIGLQCDTNMLGALRLKP